MTSPDGTVQDAVERMKGAMSGYLRDLAAMAPPKRAGGPSPGSSWAKILHGVADVFRGAAEIVEGPGGSQPPAPPRTQEGSDPFEFSRPPAPPEGPEPFAEAPPDPFDVPGGWQPPAPPRTQERAQVPAAAPSDVTAGPGGSQPPMRFACEEVFRQAREPDRAAKLSADPVAWAGAVSYYSQLAAADKAKAPDAALSIEALPPIRLAEATVSVVADFNRYWDEAQKAVTEALGKGHIDLDDATQVRLKLGNKIGA